MKNVIVKAVKFMSVKLFQHQKEALALTKGKTHVAYYLDMGLGKTFCASEKLLEFDNDYTLIVCQKSKVDDWVQHFKGLYSNIFDIYDMTKIDVDWNNYSPSKHPSKRKIMVINYELLWRRPGFNKLCDFCLVLDESSEIQHENTNKTKFILKMNPKFNSLILLSGTPVSGKYENLWTQVNLLGWKISKTLFWNTYVDFFQVNQPGMWFKKINGYKNIPRLKAKLREYGAVFMKSDEVLDLPDQITQKISVPVSKEYKTFDKEWFIKVDGHELVGDTTLNRILYERQLCGQYSKAKQDAFKDLLNSTEDRLIVFYNFNAELAILKKLAKDRPISVINGSIKDFSAYEKYGNSVTFVQYQAGSKGLNLQKANKMIYFTLPLSCDNFMQSKKRIHRIGQNRTCFYYYLLVKDSIEEDVLDALNKGRDYTNELFRKEFKDE
jgi:SNF2 family DNA or RNA helicase